MGEAERKSDHRQADGPVVGLTGARFGGAAGRRRRRTDPERRYRDPEEQYRELEQQYRELQQQYRMARPTPTDAVGDTASEQRAPADDADWVMPAEAYDLVRPYSWTGGRTASSHDLAVEALISATGQEPDPAASPEHHAIHELCATPRSVAELAALLSVPLGVVRVVLGDMAAAGSVLVHDTVGTADGAPDLALMQRVLDCLQRL